MVCVSPEAAKKQSFYSPGQISRFTRNDKQSFFSLSTSMRKVIILICHFEPASVEKSAEG
jgi:hypothetical protein